MRRRIPKHIPSFDSAGATCIGLNPGTWRATAVGERKAAMICCGGCHRIFTILDAQIAPNGDVLGQAVSCPWEACNWSVWATLEGWEP